MGSSSCGMQEATAQGGSRGQPGPCVASTGTPATRPAAARAPQRRPRRQCRPVRTRCRASANSDPSPAVAAQHQTALSARYGRRMAAVDSRIEEVNNFTSERLKFAAISRRQSALLTTRPTPACRPCRKHGEGLGIRPSRGGEQDLRGQQHPAVQGAEAGDRGDRGDAGSGPRAPQRARSIDHGRGGMLQRRRGQDAHHRADRDHGHQATRTACRSSSRGMVRSGWSMAPAGTVATSTPHNANSASATVALIAPGRTRRWG